jgi:hypothetical protein
MKYIESLRSSIHVKANGNTSATLDLLIPNYKGFKFSHLGYPKMDEWNVSLNNLLFKDIVCTSPSTAQHDSPLFSLIYIRVPEFKESSIRENITYYPAREFKNLPEGTEGYIIDKQLERMSPFVLRNGSLYHKNNNDLMVLDLYKEFFVTKLGE